MAKTRELVPVAKRSSQMFDRLHGKGLLQNEDGQLYHETYVFSEIPFSDQDIYHEIGAGEDGRLDLISFKYYGTPLLDWVIMLANPELAHPVKDAAPGITLRLPPLEYVYSNLIKG